MIVPLDVIVFMVLLITAVLALRAKDLLTSVALLSAYSLFTSVLFAGVTALDVALVEVALGAGLTGLLLVLAILATTRETSSGPSAMTRVVVGAVVAAFLAVMLFASSGLPDRGETDTPAHRGIARTYLESSLEDTETPNVVTALLADYRSADTLGETMVILTAALAATLVLARRHDDDEEPDDEMPDDEMPDDEMPDDEAPADEGVARDREVPR